MKKIVYLLAPLMAISFLTSCEKPVPTYTITWEDEDGTVLEIDENVRRGTLPTYDSDLPIKPHDDTYYYAFKDWSPEVKKATESTTYRATYNSYSIADFAAFIRVEIPKDATNLTVSFDYSCEEGDHVVTDWGDNSSDDESGVLLHTYSNPGVYDIKIKSATGLYSKRGKEFIKELYFGGTLNKIDYEGFSDCTSLVSVYFLSNVTLIDSEAFSGCSSLASIMVDENNPNYDSRNNCNAIITKADIDRSTSANTLIVGCKNTTIPSGVTSIGGGAFSCGSSPTSIIIPDGVTSIGYSAFEGCSSLTSIEIPSTVTSIGYSAFKSCSSLTSIEIPSTVTSIETSAFFDCSSLTSINIPNSVTSIKGDAFSGCSSLALIEIPSSVTSIKGDAFSGCSSLASIVVDENNPNYDSRENCNAIIAKKDIDYSTSANTLIVGCCTNPIFPSTVTTIGGNAFNGRSSLTSINIPSNITLINKGAFSNCPALSSIVVDGNNPNYDSRNNCNAIITKTDIDYSTPANMLVVGCVSTVIPDEVTSIGESAFSDCSSLVSIVIPDEVTSIGSYAFFGCSSLTSIQIPGSVTSIGNSAFSDCSSLVSIVISEGVTSIGSSAFSGCSSLTSIKIPSTLVFFDYRAFSNNPMLSLVDITSYTNPEYVPGESGSSSVFIGCSDDLKFKTANEEMANVFKETGGVWPTDINSYFWD